MKPLKVVFLILLLVFSVTCVSVSPTSVSTPDAQKGNGQNTGSPEVGASPTKSTPGTVASDGRIFPGNADQIVLLGMIESGGALGVAWSPDGSRLAVGRDSDITFYDSGTLNAINSFECHTGTHIKNISFNPDGSLLASWCGTLQVLDVVSGERIAEFQNRNGPFAFSPDGSILAASGENSVWLYDTTDFSIPPRVMREDGDFNFTSLAFNPDGSRLATTDRFGTIQLWEIATGEQITSRLSDFTDRIAWNPNGSLLASLGFEGLQLLDPGTLEARSIVTDVLMNDGQLAFNPDGTLLAVPVSQNSIILLDAATWQTLMILNTPGVDTFSESNSGLAFNPDGTRLASITCDFGGSSQEGAVYIWGLGTPITTPTPKPTRTQVPTSTPTPTDMPGERFYLNEMNLLTLDPPADNSESFHECLSACSVTWSIELDRTIQGNLYSYKLNSIGGNYEVHILHERDGQKTVLAEWMDRSSSMGQQNGPQLHAQAGDILSIEIKMPHGGMFWIWSKSFASSFTIGSTDQVLPSETPRPCYSAERGGGMEFEVPLKPGEKNTISWSIRNTGSCEWDPNFRLVFVSGDQMSAPDFINFGTVVHINDYTYPFVIITAPIIPGVYEGLWLLEAPDGTRFGVQPGGMTPLRIRIRVEP